MIGKEQDHDRISNFPDSLLHHVLSFLETKIVARASVLSSRWKYIWTSIPNLKFKREWWRNSPSDATDAFINFVDGTLHRRCLSDNSIQKFYLKSRMHLDESRLNSWISIVLSHKVKDLSLLLNQDNPLDIPLSISTCESLVSLQLRTHTHVSFPNDITFLRLKRLRLSDFQLRNNCWNDKLFSNSPVLEELYLDSCVFLPPNFCISIPSLKILKISDVSHGTQNCALKIYAPSLLTLIYKGLVAKEYALSTFVTLEEAVVGVYGGYRETSKDEAVTQIFQALTHVKCLTVDVPSLKANDQFIRNLPTYHNVKRLKMTQVPNYSDVIVIALLKATPNLESLVIEKMEPFFDLEDYEDDSGGDYEGEESDDTEDDDNVSDVSSVHDSDKDEDKHKVDSWESLDMEATESLFLHLKSVCFKPMLWTPREISCVEVILRNAKALQSLTIYHDFCGRPLKVTEQELMLQIESFPRASACCMFKICSGS